jgi:hypothetical protein
VCGGIIERLLFVGVVRACVYVVREGS